MFLKAQDQRMDGGWEENRRSQQLAKSNGICKCINALKAINSTNTYWPTPMTAKKGGGLIKNCVSQCLLEEQFGGSLDDEDLNAGALDANSQGSISYNLGTHFMEIDLNTNNIYSILQHLQPMSRSFRSQLPFYHIISLTKDGKFTSL